MCGANAARRAEQFKWSPTFGALTRGNMGMSIMPGSTSVWDRAAGQMVPCTAVLCPNADAITRPDPQVGRLLRGALRRAHNACVDARSCNGRGHARARCAQGGSGNATLWVNRVAYSGQASFGPSVNAYSDAGYHEVCALSFAPGALPTANGRPRQTGMFVYPSTHPGQIAGRCCCRALLPLLKQRALLAPSLQVAYQLCTFVGGQLLNSNQFSYLPLVPFGPIKSNQV